MPLRPFRPRPTPPPPQPTPPPTMPTEEEKIELVQLYGSVSSISAGKYATIIEYTVPEGYVAEIVGIGIIPDWDETNLVSYAEHVKVAANDEEFYPPGTMKALCRRYMNWFSFGAPSYKKPLFKFGEPGNPSSLTLKFNSKDKIGLRVYADESNDAGAVKARLLLALYNEAAAMRLFGVDVKSFATLPGGHSQGAVKRFLGIDYAKLSDATSGAQKWETLYERELKDYETWYVTHIGVYSKSDHAKYLRLRDNRTREVIPHREYGWIISQNENMLPFGDAEEELGPVEILDFFKRRYTNTTLEVQIMDDGTAVSAGEVIVQLRGLYVYGGGV